jgi:uncharacterized protein YhbP (UPF0306 family)
MAIVRTGRRVAPARLRSLAERLLDASTLCSIATVTPRGRAHVNTAYFAWTPELDVVWLSDPQAQHSRNIRANGSVAVAVYDSAQTWGKPDRGIQLFGTAREDDGADAPYAARFPDYRRSDLGAYRLYVVRAQRLKLFDEPELGSGVFVTARVAADRRLVWERTEQYR